MKILYRLCVYCLLISSSLSANAAVDYEIKGSTDQQATDNIKVYLSAISAPTSIDNISYLNEVEETAKESLTALGYYQPEITTSINEQGDKQTVILNVNLGQRITITEVDLRITGEALQDANFQQYMLDFPIKEGGYLNHSEYAAAKSRFTSLAQRYGYFDAEFSKSSVEVTQKNNTAIVHLWFDSGIRYQFGELFFDIDTPAEKYIRSLVNFNVGDPFDTNILNSYNQELNQTGYFKSISILPNMEKKQVRSIPLHVITYMNPEDSFTAGLGFSTDEGVRGTFGWTRPWINQYGHSIEASLTASDPKQEASIVYKIPIDDPLYNYYSIQNGYKMLDQNDTDTKQYVVSFNRHWRLDNDWLRTIYLRYDNESGTQGQQDFSTALILPGISFSKTRSRGGINVDWGDKKQVFFEFAEDSLLSTDDVVKVYGQTKFIRTYSGHQFVASAEVGAIFSESIYDVPSSMRFFTGGDQSIRGYGYEDIAPEDSDGYLIGGSYLATASLEYRFPIAESWKLAVFSDVGTATDDFSEALSKSVGGGVVWASPVGPIRLYVAAPLTDTGDSFKIHFMIGPEL
ncbi:outer membrane protein assembly factor [Psychromonas sp. B3M02]|uniref:autotransporter assembly complex protein TamA n=1 Tax=Psychromonas sp. B3M02 TaxID=2267226 RepID=UPI000DE9B1A1|nr:autotransporter assembly complex family protein [Psychromonas sp. B3M02]RBW46572.1 outer membrane protein assembly factor [Psychromonas sp. B3M02]